MRGERRRLLRDRRGASALEFALLVPLLALLFTGVAEAALYIRSWHRLERVAAETANIASQYETLSSSDLATIFEAANTIASPWKAWTTGTDFNARTLISLVTGTAAGNVLSWTCSRGQATLTAQVAGRSSLPNGYVVPANQTLLVVEVISQERRWRLFASSVFATSPDAPMRTYALLRPRLASLNTVTGGCPA
jgi:Flp pilus assembly protein TadG